MIQRLKNAKCRTNEKVHSMGQNERSSPQNEVISTWCEMLSPCVLTITKQKITPRPPPAPDWLYIHGLWNFGEQAP